MKFITVIMLALLAGNLWAKSAADYLPPDSDLDPSIPTPESLLGWDVGDWHVSHDKLVQYMHVLADASPRLTLDVIGQTWEQRPLLQLTVTSPENHARIESLRQAHLQGDGPLVVWLGYSVHGDEPSGSNAAMLVAYYLAASRSTTVEQWLDGTVILIDPSINPDGLNRFASWANSNARSVPVSDPVDRQHVQNWPGARTNHYGFDLNRDWLPMVNPGSQARISEFQRWRPHLLTDHHEQGRLPGFFFQPGVPSRQNPLTPDENLELTRALAQFHASAMDEVGQPFFTEEAYDDFYFGKGSTYPDINGSIGILFEQKAIRGQVLETSNGVETFQQAVANQLAVSLSSLRGAWALQDRFKSYQSGFYATMMKRAEKQDFAGWLVGDDGDPGRARAFLEILDLHGIEYRSLAGTHREGNQEFRASEAWVIPARQRQFGLLQAIMEQRKTFADNTFYDVSAWTLPLAYNLPFTTVRRLPETDGPVESSPGYAPAGNAIAWIVSWNQLEAPALLQSLLDAGARVRTAKKAFTAQTKTGLQSFRPGALVIQRGIQDEEKREGITTLLNEAALNGLEIASVESTMTSAGPDLGSINFVLLEPVKPLILGGKSSSPYDVGEVRFLLDQRLGNPAPLTEMQHFGRVDLSRYTHLLLSDGDYGDLSSTEEKRIALWVKDGGILITVGESANWAEDLCFESSKNDCDEDEAEETKEPPPASRPYGDFDDDRAKQVIGGAIVSTLADLSHPLVFGYQRANLPLFRRGTAELQPSDNAYSTPVRYAQDPLLAGFIGEERLDAMRGAPALIAERQGDGMVVRFANNPLFRGFWRGTERLYINALYFGQVVKPTDLPEFEPVPKPEAPRHQ